MTASYGQRLAIDGTYNVRDLGGYPVAGGQRVAPGRVFRSEALSYPGASEEHAIFDSTSSVALQALRLRTVVDLRSELEREKARSAWTEATGAEVVHVPVAEGGEGTDTYVMRDLLDGSATRFGVEEMVALYATTLARRAGAFGTALRVVADGDRLPVLVHCTAGKDRTGLLVALLLSALGTPRDLVVDDYALTMTFRPDRVLLYAERFARLGLAVEDVRVLFETPREVMELTLDHLDRRYGGPVAYLSSTAGLSAEDLERIRANLTTDEGP